MANMDQTQLLVFIQQICMKSAYSADNAVAGRRLEQLREIMKAQSVNDNLIELLNDVIRALPETLDCVRTTTSLSTDDLQIAFRRGEERRKRELEALRHGRC